MSRQHLAAWLERTNSSTAYERLPVRRVPLPSRQPAAHNATVDSALITIGSVAIAFGMAGLLLRRILPPFSWLKTSRWLRWNLAWILFGMSSWAEIIPRMVGASSLTQSWFMTLGFAATAAAGLLTWGAERGQRA